MNRCCGHLKLCRKLPIDHCDALCLCLKLVYKENLNEEALESLTFTVLVAFLRRNKYLFCQKPGRKEHAFYRDLYPQILQEIEVIIVLLLLYWIRKFLMCLYQCIPT